MEIVVSTPHGHADIDIVSAPPETTLADVIRAVTGQAVPATASVDGRVTPTSDRLADLHLYIGANIDTTSVDPYGDAYRNEVVRLVQITGHGAGHAIPLSPGRHRVGSARRLRADELERASVETTAFELDIAADGATTVIPVSGGDDVIDGSIGVYTPTLDGSALDGERTWSQGRLSFAGRVFELDEARPDDPPARRTKPSPDGTIPFQRRFDESVSPRRPVVDAARDARRRSNRLWRRRRSHADAFQIAYGLQADTVTDAVIDLHHHDNVALVGSDRFTLALARTLLVEAVTLHGPADLNVVVATVPERITFWNWAKWLPHIRRGDPTSAPDLLSGDDELKRWASFAGGSSTTSPDGAPDRGPITLLVLDHVDLWSRRESPLANLLAAPPSDMRVVAICSDMEQVPGRSSDMIEEVPPQDHPFDLTKTAGALRPALFGSLARQHSRVGDEPDLVTDIRPALTDARLSVRVARRLAPLDDLEAVRRAPTPADPAAPALVELVEDATGPGLHVAIGALVPDPVSPPTRYEPMIIDLETAGPIAIVCSDRRRSTDTVAALVLGAATRHSPEHLSMLAIGDEPAAWYDDLPHLAGWASPHDDPYRLVHRVSHVIDDQPELHVLVIIDEVMDPSRPERSSLLDAFLSLSETVSHVHLVVTTDSYDSMSSARWGRFGSIASIDASGSGTIDRTNSTDEFVAVSRREDLPGEVEVRVPLVIEPITHPRAMTPLERRLTRIGDKQTVPDRDDLATAAIAQKIASRFVGDSGTDDDIAPPRPQTLLPPPLPAEIEFTRLMEEFTGDGIPLGLIDRPERAESEVHWWQPGREGSIVAVGSPRAGLTGLLDLLLAGMAARMSADDLHVYAIEGLPQRRRVLDALPHSGDVVAPDDATSVALLVDALHEVMLERNTRPDESDRPDIVLLAGDLGRIRHALAPDAVDDVFDRLSEIAVSGGSVGINLIAIGARADDLGALTRLTGDRLVGSIIDTSDRARLGAPETTAADRHPRRCWSVASERLVQLAAPPELFEDAILDMGAEPAERHRPARLLSGGTS